MNKQKRTVKNIVFAKLGNALRFIFMRKDRERYSIFLTIDDLPAWNYFEIVETNDLKHLVISGNPKLERLAEVWEDIHYQMLDEFPLNPEAQEEMHVKRQLFALNNEYFITGNREILNRINRQKKRLEELTERKTTRKHQSAEKTAAILHASFGTPIDLKTISICRFFHLVNLHKEKTESHGKVI